ncbi:MAG: Kiwa anti-phage protein KwaB-like domain-containing protein [Syntrophomonas sp.]
MFENSSVMVLKVVNKAVEVYRLELEGETQAAICNTFSNAVEDLIADKEKVMFDGSYKPHEDEFLAIENFQLQDDIKDAVRDPIGVAAYQKLDEEFPEIRAIFVGEREEIGDAEKFTVAFQRFRKDQYISTKWYNLFFENDTFFQEKRFGISISDTVDCYFTDGQLQFISYFFARQVFDLSEYYRSATDYEVQSFSANDRLSIENPATFQSMANSWIRRKIAMINDSGVLENYTASKIKSLAKVAGIEITVDNKKVVIPSDKEKVKIILGFLDEEAYKGPFSQTTYLANSKRKIQQN